MAKTAGDRPKLKQKKPRWKNDLQECRNVRGTWAGGYVPALSRYLYMRRVGPDDVGNDWSVKIES